MVLLHILYEFSDPFVLKGRAIRIRLDPKVEVLAAQFCQSYQIKLKLVHTGGSGAAAPAFYRASDLGIQLRFSNPLEWRFNSPISTTPARVGALIGCHRV